MRSFLLWIIGLFVSAGILWAQIPSPPALVLTSQENGTEPQDSFSCLGKIHGYLVLPAIAVGEHTLEGIWTKPNGVVASHSRNVIEFAPPGRTTAYIWFAFPEKSLLPGAIEPAQDQEQLSYTGRWRLNVRWDNQPLLQSTFTVRCQ